MSGTVPNEQVDYVGLIALLGAPNLPPGGEGGVDAILNAVPRSAVTIVDLGCNTGWITERLARHAPLARVIGVDIDVRMIGAATRHAERSGVAERCTFLTLDAAQLDRHFRDVDCIVCAGSGAFLVDPGHVFSAVRNALAPDGIVVDAHYLYSPELPEMLAAEEQRMFGVPTPKRTASDWLAIYERAGLVVRTVHVLPPFIFVDRPGSQVARDVLRQNGYSDAVDAVVARREFANVLANFRRPAVFSLDRTRPPVAAQASQDDIPPRLLAVWQLLREPMPRRPISDIERLSPILFAAYIGEPLAAPRGPATVERIIRLLIEAGIKSGDLVLDVGCFTGVSTIVLARAFPRVQGIDVEADAILVAKAVGEKLSWSGEFRVEDAAATTLPANAVAAFVMTDTLAYAAKPKAILAEAQRVLRPDGVLIECLYDAGFNSGIPEEFLRETVSPHIVPKRLAAAVREIESSGFFLDRLERLPGRLPLTRGEQAVETQVFLETMSNPLLQTEADVGRFRFLLNKYAARDAQDQEGRVPEAFVCLFRKTGSARSLM